jgi:hypothetical protein
LNIFFVIHKFQGGQRSFFSYFAFSILLLRKFQGGGVFRACKKMWNVAKIMGRSFCSYRSSYQGWAEPPQQEARGRGHRRNLFPPGCLDCIKPRQEIGKSPRACHHCNPKRLFGWGCCLVDPHFGSTWERLRSGDMLSEWDALARSFPRLERYQH